MRLRKGIGLVLRRQRGLYTDPIRGRITEVLPPG